MACEAGTAELTSWENHNRSEQRNRRNHPSRCRQTTLTSFEKKAPQPFSRNERENYEKRNSEFKCNYCTSSQHSVTECRKFVALPVRARWDWAKQNGVCFLCLRDTHRKRDCSARKCKVKGCRRAHHHFLHPYKFEQSGNSSNVTKKSDNKKDNSTETSGETVMILEGSRGRISTHALLDEGTTRTLLDTEVARRLGIKGPKRRLSLHGIRGMSVTSDEVEKVAVNIGAI